MNETNRDANVTINLSAEQAAVLGTDVYRLTDAVELALIGMVAMRDRDAVGEATIPARMASTGGKDFDALLISYVTDLINTMEGVRDAAIRAHAAHGGSYGELAAALGVVRATAQRRRDAVTAATPSPAELFATGSHGPVDHPGVRVPDALRSWSQAWPSYCPVDITPAELREGSITEEAWISDYQTDPAGIDGMVDRSLSALIPFDLDDCWRPLNPQGRTGRSGRNLGKWGENQAADPVVIAGHGADRRVLLIKRSDVSQWALPGGMVDPGETATTAARRELQEETGVALADLTPTILGRHYVEDWRATDHAWVVTTAALYTLDTAVDAVAADDADDAAWFPATDIDTLTNAITAAGGVLYPAHRDLLDTAINHTTARTTGSRQGGQHTQKESTVAKDKGSVTNINHGGTVAVQSGKGDSNTNVTNINRGGVVGIQGGDIDGNNIVIG